MSNLIGDSADPQVPAVSGKHTATGIGVIASSDQGVAVRAIATKEAAVYATSDKGSGVDARSNENDAVHGASEKFSGVKGVAKSNNGVWGETSSPEASGVYGHNSSSGFGVAGASDQGIGILGRGGRLAGLFEGDVEVTGDVRLTGADCAEEFDVAGIEKIEPGTVLVIDENSRLRSSEKPFDKKVAGVVSGAGGYKPGIILDKNSTLNKRLPIALTGKVYCKVDARYYPIEVGDLLTTSPTSGHAMKADDPLKAFGAVIGKALASLREGTGLIPILVALQ
jgi:hypothetical protein